MKNTFNFANFLLISFITILSFNTYSQQIEYDIYAISGINGNKMNDSTVVGGDVGYIAGYWKNENVTQYPTLPNFTYAKVYGINNSGVIVGYNYNAGLEESTAMLWENDTTINLGILPGFVNSRATGINSNGIIVGNSSMGNVGDISSDSSMSFQIINNNMQIINIPNGYRGSAAWDINDVNSIAGIAVYSETPKSDKLQHAAVWINGSMSDINGSFDQSQAFGINNKNQVCGWGWVDSESRWEAFIWSSGLTKLGTLPGYDHSQANAINDSSIVVGTCPYGPGPQTGVIWKNNIIIDLNTLISPESGVTITNAVDINNDGEILVRGSGPNSYIDTYILKPVKSTVTSTDPDEFFINEYPLLQNYPNPFNLNTKIKYSIAKSSNVIIKVLDFQGRTIDMVVDEEKPAGVYEIIWHAGNLPGGVYFYQLNVAGLVETKKMVLKR